MTKRRLKIVLNETILKLSFPFFSLTAMKLTACKNCMNLEGEDWESLCSNGFTFVLKMGIINACSCWTISTFFISMISMGGFYWFTLHMMGVSLFTLLEIAESFNEHGLIILRPGWAQIICFFKSCSS